MMEIVWYDSRVVFPSSTVMFVGAGPGDPGLMTVAGVDALRAASIVFYDYLIPPSILEFAAGAELILVGKSRGHHSKRQDDINALLVSYAQNGHRVVRLKGGDPSVFGRLGEEMEYLKSNNVGYRVIPGVSSATAAPIYAGIPLTFREVARSVAFVTATTFSNVDALGDLHIPTADTVVFFMPLAHLEALTCRVAGSGGFSEETPAAVISSGTTGAHRHIVGNLRTIAALAREHKMESPSLLVVGEVCRFAADLQWFVPQGNHEEPFICR